MRLWPLRDFAEDSYRRVDDRPFGGGPGMVMLAEPLLRALAAVNADRGGAPVQVLNFSPTGQRIDQALVQQIAAGPGAVLLCGRYEGIDQRVIDSRVTLELSLPTNPVGSLSVELDQVEVAVVDPHDRSAVWNTFFRPRDVSGIVFIHTWDSDRAIADVSVLDVLLVDALGRRCMVQARVHTP